MSTEQYRLIADEHHDRVEKGKRILGNKREIICNLANCPNNPIAPKIDRVVTLGCGVFGVLFGTAIIVMFLQALFEAEPIFTYVTGVLLFVDAGAFCILGIGYTNFASSLTAHAQQHHARIIFQTFVDRGQVAEGRVLFTQTRANSNKKITYQFSLPNAETRVTGTFVTSTRRNFPDGCKVAVLYLDRHMHILL
jgi:hypothetical protein